MTRRTALLAAGACVVLPRISAASTLAIARELRRMVGFQVVAADDVRWAWRAENGERFIDLRESGLFKIRLAGVHTPPAFSEAILFAKPVTTELRRRVPSLPARAYFEYRMLIDGEFYHVEAYD